MQRGLSDTVLPVLPNPQPCDLNTLLEVGDRGPYFLGGVEGGLVNGFLLPETLEYWD